MEVFQWISDQFWQEKFWLPPNATWKVLEEARQEGMFIPKPIHMLIPFPIAVCLFFMRLMWER